MAHAHVVGDLHKLGLSKPYLKDATYITDLLNAGRTWYNTGNPLLHATF